VIQFVVESHMNNALLAIFISAGTAVLVVGLVIYRLLWAAGQFSGFTVLPRSLRRWQRWIQGEVADRK